MKDKRIIARLMGGLGAAIAAGTVFVSIHALNASPAMLQPPAGAAERADAMMSAVCRGDYSAAGRMMYGTPSLGTAPGADDGAEGLIWDAFVNSISYDFPGECYASDLGVALDVHIRSLKVSSVTDSLKTRSQALLNERVATAESVSDVYDENNEYREELISDVLCEAVRNALKEDAEMQDLVIPLYLVFEKNEWWVQPNAELLDVLSGSVSD